MAFKAYCAMDIFSRKVVGSRVEEREVDDLAVEMFEIAFGEHGIPGAVHADSGAAMRSSAVADLLAAYGVTKTHNRPRVSNDNPFSKSEFRTMKYRPGYPGTFETLEEARAHLDEYVAWYNGNHKHSGIALFSPNEVHDGSWREARQRRDAVQQAYYDAHPERFRKRPRTPAPPGSSASTSPNPSNNHSPHDSTQPDNDRSQQNQTSILTKHPINHEACNKGSYERVDSWAAGGLRRTTSPVSADLRAASSTRRLARTSEQSTGAACPRAMLACTRG